MGWMGWIVNVVMDGGILIIEWDEVIGYIFMIGLVVKVFDGIIELRE